MANSNTSGSESADPKARLPWMRPFVIVLLVIVTPAVLYWFVYATRRVDAWEREAWLVLEGIARELNAEFKVQSAIANPTNGPDDVEAKADSKVVTFGFGEVKNSLKLADLVQLKSRGHFDEIVILDATNGSVLASSANIPPLPGVDGIELRGPAGTRLKIKNRALVDVETKNSDAEDDKESRQKVDQYAEPSSAIERLLGLRRHPRIEVAGIEYAVLLMPMRIEVRGEGKPIDYMIGGLVSADRLSGHALRLSPIALVWIAALVTGAFLVLPFVKIRFMGRRERLLAWDMWMLAGSALLGTGIATLLILQLDAYSRELQTMDADLLRFTGRARDAADSEIELAFEQLKTSAPEIVRVSNSVGDIPASKFRSYSHFAALFLTDHQRQVAKWIPESTATPLVTLSDQEWFPRALEMRDAEYVVDLTVAKKTTGLDLVVVATPIGTDRGAFSIGADLPSASRTGLAVIATQLDAIREADLPRPFQFVVVRPDDGIIAMRSSHRASHRESFFAEAPDMEGLVRRAAAEWTSVRDAAGQPIKPVIPDPTDHRFGGSMQRVTATPLWQDANGRAPVLVAFYDKEPVEALAARLVVNASCWLVLLVAACLAAAAAARAFHHRALDLAWPTRSRGPLYFVGCILFAASGALLLRANRLPEWTLPYLVVGAPALALFTLALVAARLKSPPVGLQIPEPPGYPSSYVVFVILGLIALIAMPMFIIFRDSEAGHRAALEEWIRSSKPVSPGYEFGDASIAARSPAHSVPESWCRGLLRADPERLPQRHFSLALFTCLPTSVRDPILTASPLAIVDGNDVAPRGSGSSARRTVWLMLLSLGALSLLWWFVREVGTKILGLRLEGDGVVDGSGQIPGGLSPRSLLLRPPEPMLQAAKEAIAANQGAVIDLRAEGDAVALGKRLANPGLAWLITGLEWRLDDPTWRNELLALLEAKRTAPLVLVAGVDPLYFLQHRGRELEGTSKLAESEIERWSRALGDVHKIRFPLLPVLSALPTGVHPRLAKWVCEECCWDDRLAAIGDALLARSDLASFNRDDVVEYVLDEADAHYRAMWSLCCVAERLVLVQLAEEGLVNPRCFDLLRRLRRRRLVRVDPRFRLMNKSFRRFVLETEERSTVLAWEREGSAESSARVRGPLLALAFVAAAILLLTQGRELADMLGYASVTGSFVALVASAAARFRGTPA